MTTVPPLRPNAGFTDSKGTLTKGGYDFLYNMFLRIGGSLDSLNAVYLADKTWDAPNPIGTTVPNSGKFTTLQATGNTTLAATTATSIVTPSIITSTLRADASVSQGTGLKHGRVTTGAILAGASALVTLTWPSPFANTNYTVVASLLDLTISATALRIVHIESQTASAVIVRVENTSAITITGTLNLIAMHD